jgi:hypothetical protein
MGTAVISASDLFRRRDFDPRRKVRSPARSAQFLGQFASLGHVNAHLQKRRSVGQIGNLRPIGNRPSRSLRRAS